MKLQERSFFFIKTPFFIHVRMIIAMQNPTVSHVSLGVKLTLLRIFDSVCN